MTLARVLKGSCGPPPWRAPRDHRSCHGHARRAGHRAQLGLEELIDRCIAAPGLVTAMAVAQVIAPDSKLAIAAGCARRAPQLLGEILHWVAATRMTSTARWTGWPPAGEDRGHARGRHLAGGTRPLRRLRRVRGPDLPLGAIGHPKDGVRGRLQIVYGLLTSKDGVRSPSRSSPATPATHHRRSRSARSRTGSPHRVVLVGDRGMLTAARLREDIRPADWTGSPRCAPAGQGTGPRRRAPAVLLR